MPNQFNGLIVEGVNITTENINRKLNKKIREIERLELKDYEILIFSEKEKIGNKDYILEQLNKNNIQHLCGTKEQKKKKKKKNLSFEEMERIQLEYKLLKEQKKREKIILHEEHWREKYKTYEHYRYNSISIPGKIIKNACHILKIKANNITKNIVKLQYYKLARLYHPDKGGNHEDMVRLSTSYGILNTYLNL